MENNKKIEIIVASLFLITLILVTIAIFSFENKTRINYSSNTIAIQTINYPSKITKCEVKKIPYEVYSTTPAYSKTTILSSEKLTYQDSSKSYIKEGMFGEQIQVYEVNLKNTGCSGGYFNVEYSFTTLCGDTRQEYVREYIPYNKDKTFTYKNIQGDREKIASWNYKIISETESCSNTQNQIVPEKTIKETQYKDEVVCFQV